MTEPSPAERDVAIAEILKRACCRGLIDLQSRRNIESRGQAFVIAVVRTEYFILKASCCLEVHRSLRQFLVAHSHRYSLSHLLMRCLDVKMSPYLPCSRH